MFSFTYWIDLILSSIDAAVDWNHNKLTSKRPLAARANVVRYVLKSTRASALIIRRVERQSAVRAEAMQATVHTMQKYGTPILS